MIYIIHSICLIFWIWYGLGYHGYTGYGYLYSSYGGWRYFGKCSADAEPEADTKVQAVPAHYYAESPYNYRYGLGFASYFATPSQDKPIMLLPQSLLSLPLFLPQLPLLPPPMHMLSLPILMHAAYQPYAAFPGYP